MSNNDTTNQPIPAGYKITKQPCRQPLASATAGALCQTPAGVYVLWQWDGTTSSVDQAWASSLDLMVTLRSRLGWTQAQIAEQLGITPNGYAMIERGERRISKPLALLGKAIAAREGVE